MTEITYSKLSCLAHDLDRAFYAVQEFLDETGGCDHSVGICYCDEYRLLDDLRGDRAWLSQAISEMGP